ncbi:MAG: Extracellular ligand-binding receptor [Candidatus Nomurabacteria bacterium]|nr:Extracellular ligand-binding receptor [Candidatus Nomurabacteria bacterium]
MTKNILLGFLSVVFIILLISFFLGQRPSILGAHKENGDTVKVGGALALTNYCSSWGEDELKSITLAIEEANKSGGINGHPLELITEDTECSQKGTVNAVSKLIDSDKAEIIIGPTWSDTYQSGYPVINNNKIVSITPSAAIEAVIYGKLPIDYIFSTYFPQRKEVQAMESYMNQNNKRNIVIMHDQDPFGVILMSIFKDEADAHNIKVIKEYTLPTNYIDFRTEIAELKNMNIDGIYASFPNPEKKGKFLKQAHDLGLTVQLFSSADVQDAELVKQFSSTMNGVIYTYPEASGGYEEFKANFISKYGTEPSGPSVTNAYDATNVAINALRKHYENGIDIKTAVEKTNIPGVTVPNIQFNDIHGIKDSQFVIKTIKNGKFVEIK